MIKEKRVEFAKRLINLIKEYKPFVAMGDIILVLDSMKSLLFSKYKKDFEEEIR